LGESFLLPGDIYWLMSLLEKSSSFITAASLGGGGVNKKLAAAWAPKIPEIVFSCFGEHPNIWNIKYQLRYSDSSATCTNAVPEPEEPDAEHGYNF
jgi:hypothetical protein